MLEGIDMAKGETGGLSGPVIGHPAETLSPLQRTWRRALRRAKMVA
jgi:hypothetical protein